ncbi:type II toxin-antitoxin system RelE/ParE family toxin [Thalassotalea agariperforans]
MQIEFTESAFSDLEDLKEYYTEQLVPNVGETFIKEIIAHVETIPHNPEIGRIVPEFQDKNIRELIHKPFRVVYQLGDDTIFIIRIWRSERLLNID